MIVLFLCLVMTAPALHAAETLLPRGKKLIEYGWDVPTPAQMRQDLAIMEKRPFEGVIFRLAGGQNAFVTKPLAAAAFTEDERILRDLRFTRFTDNFVLIWGSPPAGFDWFDDAQWNIIEANAKLLVRVAQAGRVRGICFDPEPYDFSLWDYAKQPKAQVHSFADYRTKVRQRGAQLMRAFEKKMPGALILTFFHVSLYDRFADLPESERTQRLAKEGWGLMPDFFVGMLEGATPKARFIDGNENAYYYTSREQYFRAYHAIRHRALGLVPPELRDKYERQVRAGQALYVDHNFALRQPKPEQYLSYRMTPEERAKWFQHNTYWALYTTDQYVWCYSERMNWWKNQTPPGLERPSSAPDRRSPKANPSGSTSSLIEAVGKRPLSSGAAGPGHRLDGNVSPEEFENLAFRSLVTTGQVARLERALAKARRGETVTIGVIGGSITQGAAATQPEKRYGNRLAAWWRQTFPKANVLFVNAGIGATGSDYGALRDNRDLLSHHPDFVVVEYAVNDPNSQAAAETLAGFGAPDSACAQPTRGPAPLHDEPGRRQCPGMAGQSGSALRPADGELSRRPLAGDPRGANEMDRCRSGRGPPQRPRPRLLCPLHRPSARFGVGRLAHG